MYVQLPALSFETGLRSEIVILTSNPVPPTPLHFTRLYKVKCPRSGLTHLKITFYEFRYVINDLDFPTCFNQTEKVWVGIGFLNIRLNYIFFLIFRKNYVILWKIFPKPYVKHVKDGFNSKIENPSISTCVLDSVSPLWVWL